MRYLITYLDECELIQSAQLEADTEQEAQDALDTLAPQYVPVGVRLAA